MRSLETKKQLTIITAKQLENMVVETLGGHGCSGHTVVLAHGAGAFGVQSGMFDADSNILIYAVMNEDRLAGVLQDINAMMDRGHRLKAVVNDVTVLPWD